MTWNVRKYIFFIFDTKQFNFQNGLLELDFPRGKSRIYESIIYFIMFKIIQITCDTLE